MRSSRIESTRGFVIGRQQYGDSSLILRWFAEGKGRMSTVARGGLQPKSPFRGQVDLYYFCELTYRPSLQGDLHQLREVHLLEPFEGLRRDWLILLTLKYFSSLITELTESSTDLREDYFLFEKAVCYLNTHQTSIRLIERFECALMAQHGYSSHGKAAALFSLSSAGFSIPQERGRLFKELA